MSLLSPAIGGMMRRMVRLVALAAVLAACSSIPPRDALAALAQAEAAIAEGRHGEGLVILAAVPEDSYTGDDLERYKLALATAKFGTGDAWGAFAVLRRHLEDHPLSVRVDAIEKLTFAIGKTLIHGTRGFWIFWSDEDDGVFVLEHFVRRFGNSDLAADAYHLLGEVAYARKRFDEAQQHFRQITMFHGRSPWTDKAMFRYAMAGYRSLVGPDYDLDRLQTVHRELASYVENQPDNLEFAREAQAALLQTRDWLARKHVAIADFYATVDNAPGHRHHLEIAAREYPGTTAGQEAARRLQLGESGPGAGPPP